MTQGCKSRLICGKIGLTALPARPILMPEKPSLNHPPTRISLLGLASAVLYGIITWLSKDFKLSVEPAERPLLTALLLFGAAFLIYLLACCEVWPSKRSLQDEDNSEDTKTNRDRGPSRHPLWMIVGFGILFRVIMVFSIPIQEIDLYRYILDGAVGNANVSPFEYAPMELIQAVDAVKNPRIQRPPRGTVFARSSEEKETLNQLASKIASQPGLEDCLNIIHYGQYTSPYPPISQAVFRVATAIVPEAAVERTWVFAMKATLTLFDVLTGFLIIALLRQCGLSDRISLWYWWCPLAIKEIANSGHLDSIVIFLTVAFAWLAVASIWPRGDKSESPRTLGSLFLASISAVVLAMAVGAKVYPLVLAPVWAICLIRRKGLIGLMPVFYFVVVAAYCSWPILQKTSLAEKLDLVTIDHKADDVLVSQHQQITPNPNVQITRRPKAGIEMFSRYWEMNDLIFMVVIENVRPYQPKGGTAPWFLVTTENWRTEFATSMVQKYEFADTNEFAFSYTRIVTLLIYVGLTFAFCIFAWQAKSADDMLRLFFASVAWFWLLSPTLNPWYWLWAMPFVVFSKRPAAWLLLSGMLLMYYLRFYFQNHFPNDFVGPTSYRGQLFFDFVVPWIEFCPVFAVLFYQSFFGSTRIFGTTQTPPTPSESIA